MNRKSNIPNAKIDKGWKDMRAQLDEVMPAKPQRKRRPLVWWWRAAAVAVLAAVAIALSQPDIMLKKQTIEEVNTLKAPKLSSPSVSEKRNLVPTQIAPLSSSISASSIEEKREQGVVVAPTQASAAPTQAVANANTLTSSKSPSIETPTTKSAILAQADVSAENKVALQESTLPQPALQQLTPLEIRPHTDASAEIIQTLPLVPIDNDFPKLAIGTEAPTRINSRENFKFGIAAELDMAADNRINGYQAAFVLDLFTHKRLGLRTGVGFRQIQFENNRNLVIPVTADDLFSYTTNAELLNAFNTQATTSTTASRNQALPYVRRLTRIELPVNFRYAFGSRWIASAGINTVYTFDITAKSGELSFLNSFDQNTEKVADNAFNRIASNRYEVWTLDYSAGLEYRVHRCFNIGVNWQQSIGENDTFKNNKRLNIVGLRGTYFFD